MTEFENLLLNMAAGLKWSELSDREKELCRENGLDLEETNGKEEIGTQTNQ